MTWGWSLLGSGGLPRTASGARNDVGRAVCVLLAMVASAVFAEDVTQITVRQVAVVNGVTNSLATDATITANTSFTTVTAGEVSECRFVGWEVTPAQVNFASRDAWGRAYEQVSVVPNGEVVTLAAIYQTIGDEAEQLYWYGSNVVMTCDTDGDGYTFAQELQYGMNPHFPNELKLGGVTSSDSDLLLYNPNEYQPYVMRSEPEGELFASVTNYVSPGTVVTTASYSPETSNFAYWTVNGVRQADALGASVNQVAWTMASEAVEIVAHCVSDETARQSFYWYGSLVDENSDSDEDGYTFAQELQYGLNPIFKNELTYSRQ